MDKIEHNWGENFAVFLFVQIFQTTSKKALTKNRG